MDFNPLLLQNLLPRLEWEALRQVCSELGLTGLPEQKPEAGDLVAAQGDESMEVEGEGQEESEAKASPLGLELHRVLMETGVREGKLVCGNCEHAYEVKEGIANFLLPAHLV